MNIFNLNERKKLVLKAIVSDYIGTAEPVGSFAIKHNYITNISPATIRAEMAELESFGYITHPHTSAGRIPTDLGYRYYVDNMMETKIISGKEITLIKSGIRKIGNGIEDLLRGAAKVISGLLGQVAVIVSFGKSKKQVYSSGLSNVLRQPDFRDIGQARSFIETIEEEDFLANILEEYSLRKQLNIQIGRENQRKEVQDLSIIVAQSMLLGSNPGAIAVIGPTRMDYGRISSVLDFIAKEISSI